MALGHRASALIRPQSPDQRARRRQEGPSRVRQPLREADVNATVTEIRRALLEADVALPVVRAFTSAVREKAVDAARSQALNPGQQVVKIVNEELIEVLGGETREINWADRGPTIIMLAGLQGAGKTTLAGKLGRWLRDQGKRVLLVASDLQRPNAVTQLSVVGCTCGRPNPATAWATRWPWPAPVSSRHALMVTTSSSWTPPAVWVWTPR